MQGAKLKSEWKRLMVSFPLLEESSLKRVSAWPSLQKEEIDFND